MQQEFTRQAESFAANRLLHNPASVTEFVQAVAPSPEARVLDVAAGSGTVARGFAAVCREVIGIDLTAAMLDIAERLRREQGQSNLRFETGDATRLGFKDGEFDVVVCRFAFHHFDEPERVLAEMRRVCRKGGTVAVQDMIVSEDPSRAAFQNRFENMRDPSHSRALPLSALLAYFAGQNLEIEDIRLGRLQQDAEHWLANAKTPPAAAAEVRKLLAQDSAQDLSGVRPFREGGRLYFTQRTAIVVGRALPAKR